MTIFRRLESLEVPINVAVTGAGFVATGLIHQIGQTPGMRVAALVARRAERGLEAFASCGVASSSVVVSSDPQEIAQALEQRRPVVTSDISPVVKSPAIDVVVEATGDVEFGARAALAAIANRKHVVSLNYETDATVGPLILEYARHRNVVYTGSDGDQPGVMMRLIEYVEGIGLEVIVAVNCKGFLDRHATPESIAEWAVKQGTSPKMTTAFTDGTKMNVENCSVANATGLTVAKRGMTGVETDLESALSDFENVLPGTVDYTLGGDFGSGVFVIAGGAHPESAAPYLEYLKMGRGPHYLFFRPWHLVHFETPISIAEAVLDSLPTIAPSHGQVATVVAYAKRELLSGHELDGIGGRDHYGLIDTSLNGEGLLPVGLAEGAILRTSSPVDQPLSMDQIELNHDSFLVQLWKAQERLLRGDADFSGLERILDSHKGSLNEF